MWKKVNLVDPKILRRWLANAARFWRKIEKRKKDYLFNNLASLNLDF